MGKTEIESHLNFSQERSGKKIFMSVLVDVLT